MNWINSTPKRIRKKIVFYAVLYTLTALLLISFLSLLPLVEQLKQSEERSLLNIAEIRSMAVEEYLLRVRNIGLQVSSRVGRADLQDYHWGQLNRSQLRTATASRLEDALLHAEDLVGITRLDREGRVIAQAGIAPPTSLLTIPPSGTNDVSILDPQVIGGMLYLIAAVPLQGDNQERIGTDVILFTIHYLQRIVWEYTRSGEETLLGRMADQAILFFPGRFGQVEIYNQVTPYPLYFVALQEAAAGRSGLLRYPEKTDLPDFVSYAPIADTGWGLIVTIHERQLFSPVNRTLFQVAAMVFLLTLSGGIGIYLLLRPLTGQALDYWTRLENANQDLQEEISERRRAEESLRRSENEWKETFEAITDSVAIFDINGHVLKTNQAARAFLSARKQAQNADLSPLELFPSAKSESPFHRMLRTRQQESEEVFDPMAQRYLQVTVFPLFDETEEIWGGVHVVRDITEQKNMEKMKDEMLSAVSHEMRTPLTAMLGFVDFLLKNEVSPEQQREFLQTVRRETERLNELVGNFLDLQRLQADLETYHFEPTAPCNLLGEAAQLFTAASKKHRILIDCPPDLPLVQGDQKRLQQVVKNLMSNAIRYSPAGGDVCLRASRQGEMIEFQVRDEGIGIPSQVLTRIFDRFYRVDDSSRRIPGGIGLGLTMVREIIRAHGGRVWAESTLGKGSTFHFTVPVHKP